MTEFEKVNRLAVGMAIQTYLDVWLSAEHLQPLSTEHRTSINATISKIKVIVGLDDNV